MKMASVKKGPQALVEPGISSHNKAANEHARNCLKNFAVILLVPDLRGPRFQSTGQG